jgi:isoquinoline 1-oxidoreductase beta subunit
MTDQRGIAAGPPTMLSRRRFIVGATMAGGSLLVGCKPRDLMGIGAETKVGAFGPFIKIGSDGAVTVVSKHLEMGQGNHAGLAAIVAEELDADWAKVTVEQAPANAKLYANTLMGIQGTGGSTAIANSWMQLRKAGAGARAMFVLAAAQSWGVPAGELAVKDGVVSHGSEKSATFAELLPSAAKIAPPEDPALKDPASFTLIGTDRVRRKDSAAKSNGTAIFTQDIHAPNMLVAVVAHAPLFGAKVKSFDATDARKVPGVMDVIQIDTGVAVLARDTYTAKLGRDALKVVWDDSKSEKRDSDAILAEYKRIAAGQSGTLKALPFDGKGDPAAASPGATHTFSYDFPFLAHAPMEPMNCVAAVDGHSCKLNYGSQVPTLDQINTAMIVLTLPGAVEIETLFAGGSFGRRANPTSDFVVECVHIAKKVGGGRPIKLVWTREDDMTGGRYRPLAHHALSITTDSDGFPSVWRHRVVTQSIQREVPGSGSFDDTTVEGVKGSPYLKATPIVDAAVYMPVLPVPVLWWRSVGATHTAMVMEHTIDQLAHKAGKDPVDYRRAIYGKAGAAAARHLTVLNLAVEKSGYGAPLEPGWARGVAVHESFGSVIAQVAEVGLMDGEPRVRRVVTAVACGTAISPNQIAAQIEGATCFGLSAALFGAVTLKAGKVEQTNFDSYRVLRMNEAPVVETHIVPSTEPPSGIGEPGTPLIAPAVANALLVLTGKPTTALPFVKA